MSGKQGKNSAKSRQDFYEMKQKAVEYYKKNGVPDKMEEILNSMFFDNPEDVFGHLANYFEKFAARPTISKINSSVALDSRGQPTIQTSIYCKIKNHTKCVCTLTSSSPKSHIFDNAKIEEREADEAERKEDVTASVGLIQEELNSKLEGLDPTQQQHIDQLTYDFICEKKKEEELRLAEELKDSPEPVPPPPSESPTKKNKTASAKKGKAASVITLKPEEPKEKFTHGSSAVSTISQAVCSAAANVQNLPLYQYISSLCSETTQDKFCLPLPMVTILQAGKALTGKLKCIKEFMVVPKPGMPMKEAVMHIQGIYNHIAKTLYTKGGVAAKFVNDIGALCPALEKPEQGLDLLQEAITSIGLTPGEDFHIALNAAAHEMLDFEKGKYEVTAGQLKSPDDLVDFWQDIVTRYPSVIALIDPLRRQEDRQWMKLCDKISPQCFILGNHVYPRPGLLKAEELTEYFQTSGVVYKLELMNTLTDLIACTKKMEEANNITVLSTTQGDTTDSFLVDLAVGIGAKFIKIGAPSRGERISKLNRLIRLEDELEERGKLGTHGEHSFVHIEMPPPKEGEEEEAAARETPSPRKDGKKK